MDVPISHAMLLWDSALNGGAPRFAVRPLGHPDGWDYQSSSGAYFTNWRKWDADRQKFQLMIEVWHIAAFYGVPPEIMTPELLRIPEYRDMLAYDCLPKEFQD